MAEDLEKRYDNLLKVIEEGMKSTVKKRGWCPNCRKQVWVEIENIAMALKAAEFMANQGLGRPGEDQTKVENTFVVHRHVVAESDEGDSATERQVAQEENE